MPAAYAHLTMVSLLASRPELQRFTFLSRSAQGNLLSNIKFFELGAMSPDYPYLHIGDSASSAWADSMHYKNVGDRIREGINYVKLLDDNEKYKALAWLLGYVAHVVTDVTIHPVVELKVGVYEENKRDHRICEMSQDLYIYRRLNTGELNRAHLETGIATCTDDGDPGRIDPVIRSLWEKMLQSSEPEFYKNEHPKIDLWHSKFQFMMTIALAEGLFRWSRHTITTSLGLQYPPEPQLEFCESLSTPGGVQMSYDDIFNKAKENVHEHWGFVLRACLTDDVIDLSCFKNWNLDTGKDEQGNITFWEESI